MYKLTDKKYFSKRITQRFLEAMDLIVGSTTPEGKITAYAFGEQIGVSSSNLSRMRNDTDYRDITLEAVARLCYHYGYSAEWLINGTGSPRTIAQKKSAEDLIREALLMLEIEKRDSPKKKRAGIRVKQAPLKKK